MTTPPTSRRLSRSLVLEVLLGGVMAACARSPAAVSPSPAPATATRRTDPATGSGIVRAMHDRYATTWYQSLTFTQTTTISLPSGSSLVQTWLEAGKMPGRLRIDTDSMRQSGVIYAGDSVFQFAGGRLVRADTGMNDLLILGFDVYAQPADQTIAILRKRGFDLTKLASTTWEGRSAYIVGATGGDSTSKQFWVDAERLLFVRLLETRRTPTGTRREDIRFQRYVPHAGGWVAEEVVMLRDGKQSLREQYANVRINVPLADALFDPKQWSTATHWHRP